MISKNTTWKTKKYHGVGEKLIQLFQETHISNEKLIFFGSGRCLLGAFWDQKACLEGYLFRDEISDRFWTALGAKMEAKGGPKGVQNGVKKAIKNDLCGMTASDLIEMSSPS